MDGVQLPQGLSHFEEAVYFANPLPLFLGNIQPPLYLDLLQVRIVLELETKA